MTIFCSSKIEIIFMSNLKWNSNLKLISTSFFVWIRFEFATNFFFIFFLILNFACSRLCHIIICYNKIFITNKFKAMLKNKFRKIFILIFFVSNNNKVKWSITFHFFYWKAFQKNLIIFVVRCFRFVFQFFVMWRFSFCLCFLFLNVRFLIVINWCCIFVKMTWTNFLLRTLEVTQKSLFLI